MDSWSPPNEEYPPPKPGEPPLHRAAREGDAAEIVRLVSEGADVNAAFDIRLDPGAWPQLATPLMVAAGSGDGADVKTVRLLLDLDADPAIVHQGQTAATFAASGLGWNYRPGGDAERLRCLLQAGSPLAGDPEEANRALCEAARQCDTERMKVMIELGQNVDGYWNQEAARQVHAQLLPEDAFAIKGIGRLFRKQMQAFRRQMLDSLSSGPSFLEIPLFVAALSGCTDCIRLLLDHGAALSAKDNSGRTALFYARSPEMIVLLVSLGLSLDERDQHGWTPLTNALTDGISALEQVKALIDAGADVNATYDRGYTEFMSAASSSERSVEVMDLLVKSGADPLAVTELGYNAFHAAIDVNGPDANTEESIRATFTYLKNAGVDIHHENNGGETPLQRAKMFGTELEVQVLKELGAVR